jgi:hypothetical protein
MCLIRAKKSSVISGALQHHARHSSCSWGSEGGKGVVVLLLLLRLDVVVVGAVVIGNSKPKSVDNGCCTIVVCGA